MRETDRANAGDAAAVMRRPPSSVTASTTVAASRAASLGVPATAERTTDSQTLARGLEAHHQQHAPQGRRDHKNHRRQQQRRARKASSTPAVAAAGIVGRESRAQAPEENRSLAEVVVTEEEREGNTRPLVPSFCPSNPFERYVALHRDIMDGILEPRWEGGVPG